MSNCLEGKKEHLRQDSSKKKKLDSARLVMGWKNNPDPSPEACLSGDQTKGGVGRQ